MIALIIIILLLALLGILGVVVKGLLWLTLIAVVLLLAAGAYGWFKLRGSTSSGTTT
jgi:hypothetical protein